MISSDHFLCISWLKLKADEDKNSFFDERQYVGCCGVLASFPADPCPSPRRPAEGQVWNLLRERPPLKGATPLQRPVPHDQSTWTTGSTKLQLLRKRKLMSKPGEWLRSLPRDNVLMTEGWDTSQRRTTAPLTEKAGARFQGCWSSPVKCEKGRSYAESSRPSEGPVQGPRRTFKLTCWGRGPWRRRDSRWPSWEGQILGDTCWREGRDRAHWSTGAARLESSLHPSGSWWQLRWQTRCCF